MARIWLLMAGLCAVCVRNDVFDEPLTQAVCMSPKTQLRNLALHFGWLLVPKYLVWFVFFRCGLKRFKNKHSGEKCIIIGNGPSLNKMDLSLLNGCHTIGLNKIYLMFERCPVDLSYHVAVNDLVIEQSRSAFDALDCESFLSYEGSSQGVFAKLRDRFNYLLIGGELRFSEDISYPVSSGATVTYVAMQLAFYMGFDEVYLIGVDHSFRVDGEPHEKQTLRGSDTNHFDARYFSGKEWQLPDLACSEAAYHLAHYYYQRAGRRIFDATVDGRLTVFPKVDYSKAVETCRRR